MREKISVQLKKQSRLQLAINGTGLLIVLSGIIVSIKMTMVGRALWYDESALAYSLCQRSLGDLCATELDYVQSAPVGWLYFLKIFSLIFGTSTYALRTPSILAYIGVLVLTAVILRDIFGARFFMAGAAFTASLPLILQYSNVFKPYISDCFFCLLALYLFWLYQEQRLPLAGLALIWAAVVWVSNPVIFVMAGLMVSEGILSLGKGFLKKALRLILIGIPILISFFAYYILWLRQTAEDNQDMLDYWKDWHFPLIPTSIQQVRRAIILIGYLFKPFYRLEYVVMALLVVFAIHAIRKRNVYTIGLYAGFFVTAVASYLHKFPVNKRLWLFIYPLIAVIIYAGIEDLFIRGKEELKEEETDEEKALSKTAAGRSRILSAAAALFLLVLAVVNSGIRYYVNDENVYWPGYEVSLEYDYLKAHIEDEWVYVFYPIIPEFAYVNHYNEDYLDGTDHEVMYGTAIIGSGYDCSYDMDCILNGGEVYLFFSDSWDNENYTDELFINTRGTGYLEMVYNDYETPLWRYCESIDDVKSGVDFEVKEISDDGSTTTYVVEVTNAGESYLNPKFETAVITDGQGQAVELPECMAPGAQVEMALTVEDGTQATFTVENEYGPVCQDSITLDARQLRTPFQ